MIDSSCLQVGTRHCTFEVDVNDETNASCHLTYPGLHCCTAVRRKNIKHHQLCAGNIPTQSWNLNTLNAKDNLAHKLCAVRMAQGCC